MAINLIRPVASYVDKEQLDGVMETMLANDGKLLPQTSIAPKVWKCSWYNIPLNTEMRKRTYCYQPGDAVWLNTEDLDQFVQYNYDYIESVVQANSTLRYKYMETEGDKSAITELFKKVVTGEVTGNSEGLPLFYIGDSTARTRIRVSLSANNDKLPTDDAYWKDFFVDNEANAQLSILDYSDTLCERYMDAHLKEYHLSGVGMAWYDQDKQVQYQLSDMCLHNTLSNLTGEQQYVSSKELTVNKGFDWVVKYFHRRFGSSGTCKWFRVWNSGLVEHGGVVNASDIPDGTGDSLVYEGKDGSATCYRVRLNWMSNGLQAPSFKYGTSAGGFYSNDTQFDLGDGFSIALDAIGKSVNGQNRYTVQVTPGSAAVPYSQMRPTDNKRCGYYYATKEIVSMKNDSFCFVLTPGCDTYSYYAAGFSPNSQQVYR